MLESCSKTDKDYTEANAPYPPKADKESWKWTESMQAEWIIHQIQRAISIFATTCWKRMAIFIKSSYKVQVKKTLILQTYWWN